LVSRCPFDRNTTPLVFDVQNKICLLFDKPDYGCFTAGVTENVGESLLADPKEIGFEFHWETPDIGFDSQINADLRALL
jgi:hypothetical protein